MPRWWAVIVVAIGCVVACGPPPPILPAPHPASAPPSTTRPRPEALPTPRIPLRTRPYESMPKACSLVDAPTLQALIPGTHPAEIDVPHVDKVIDYTCIWSTGATPETPFLSIMVELHFGDSRQTPIEAAKSEFKQSVGDQNILNTIKAHAISKLGDEAKLGGYDKPKNRAANLDIRSQNIVIAISYGCPKNNRSLKPKVLERGAMAAGRAVLVALASR